MNTTTNHDLRPHKPWIAGVMSLALPGWGQLYNGEVNRAIWHFLTFSLLLLPGTALLALAVPPMLMAPALILGVVGTLGLWLCGVIDAYRVGQRNPSYDTKPWQSSGVYALVFITCALLVLPSLTMYMRAHLVQPFKIPSASMAPSLLPGDRVFADMHYNCPGCRAVQRGDVAIFTYPNDRTLYYVKRIVALPGDRVSVVDQKVLVNAKTDTQAEQVVPPGHVFLLGDNPSASTDSRQFGAVPLADVVGRVRQIWFSRDAGTIRWERIGNLVN